MVHVVGCNLYGIRLKDFRNIHSDVDIMIERETLIYLEFSLCLV